MEITSRKLYGLNYKISMPVFSAADQGESAAAEIMNSFYGTLADTIAEYAGHEAATVRLYTADYTVCEAEGKITVTVKLCAKKKRRAPSDISQKIMRNVWKGTRLVSHSVENGNL